jgi:hypothetical protein
MTGVRAVAGVCLVGAGVTFWLAWFLMPLPGTTDASFILEQVALTPGSVFASVAVQLASSALLVPGVLGLVQATRLRESSAAFLAAALVGIGATGFAADAIYHLLAAEMVAPGIAREAVLPVMERFQSADLAFIVPQLLALLVGVAWLVALAARAGLASPRLLGLALVAAVAGIAAARAFGGGRRGVALGVLALFSLAIAELGRGALRARS